MNARQMIAHARGVPVGDPSLCAFCGESPFPRYGSVAELVTESVYGLRTHPQVDDLCAGCRSILGGHPASMPRPLRMGNVLVVDGVFSVPSTAELRAVILAPPETAHVVSWAESKQKHHTLHAGISSPDRQLWGSDNATIIVQPAEAAEILAAIERLIAWHSKSTVESGVYLPIAIQRQGASAWMRDESVVAPVRGQRILDLLVTLAVRPEKPPTADTTRAFSDLPLFANQEDTVPIDPHQQLAAEIIAGIARSSERRATHGKEFWSTFLRRRISRHAHRPLGEFVSRMMDDCGTTSVAESTLQLVARVGELDADACDGAMTALHHCPALIVSMAYDIERKRKEKHA